MRTLRLASTLILFLLGTLYPASAQRLATLDVPLQSPDGKLANVAELGAGRVTVITFWMTSCTPSKQQLEALRPLAEEFTGRAVFIGVAIDNTKTMARVRGMFAGKESPLAILLDPNRQLYDRVNGIEHPYTLVYDASGKLMSTHPGYLEGDESKYRAEILRLLPQPSSGSN